MQKKLESELMSIAHGILKMKNNGDVKILKQRASNVYEKLALLDYIENFVKETPLNTKTVDELVDEMFTPSEAVASPIEELKIEEKIEAEKEEIKQEIVEQKVEETKKEEEEEEEEEEIDKPHKPAIDFFRKKDDNQKSKDLQSSLEKEFGNTVSLDVSTNMFENATRIEPKKSLNDIASNQKSLQIGLNDRIAFVKHLFNGSQQDFNKIISQLNTTSSEKEALDLLKKTKKEYDWSEKEIYEDRLISLVERKYN